MLYMPVPFKCFVLLRNQKMLAADAAIPNESRKMVKLRIVSNVCAKTNVIIQIRAKAVNEITSTSLFSDFFWKMPGNTPSSLIANITLGLLISNTFT